MASKAAVKRIIETLKGLYPDALCSLQYEKDYELLFSVRLSAQCTDARVNIVVEKLYEKFPDVDALADAPVEEIEAIVKPCGLGHSKARDISACMKILRDKYQGKVPDDFDELLSRIRDIRASEKRFYQKLRDLFKLSSDYETKEKATQMFYAETQNKLLYAVTGQTAAEIIRNRADENKPNMGLTVWKGDIVRKGDIVIAKNYLDNEEIDKLNRLVTIFLESAEMRVKERKDLTLDYWRKNVDAMLSFQGMELLIGKGSVAHLDMEKYVKSVYERFDKKRKAYQAQLADEEDNKLLDDLQNMIDDIK